MFSLFFRIFGMDLFTVTDLGSRLASAKHGRRGRKCQDKKKPEDSSPLLPSARGRDETQQKTSRDSEKISSRCSSHWSMKLDSQHPHHSLPCRSVGRIADERNPWPLIHRRTKPFTLDPLYDTTVINRPVIRGKKQCPQ